MAIFAVVSTFFHAIFVPWKARLKIQSKVIHLRALIQRMFCRQFRRSFNDWNFSSLDDHWKRYQFNDQMSYSLLHSFLYFDRLLSRQWFYQKSICIWLSALIVTFFKFRNFKLLFLFTPLLRYKHTCITSLFRLAELILKLKFEINSKVKKSSYFYSMWTEMSYFYSKWC